MTGTGRPRTILLGLVGRGIGASRTPGMHEAEARALGIGCVYRLIDIDRMGPEAPPLADILDWTERLGFTGLNVTYPCKQEVIPLLHTLAPAAESVGAVNTVLFRDGKRIGDNTDYWGFARAFGERFGAARKDRALLLGAGGAGVAVAHALLGAGVGTLAIADTEPARAEALAGALVRRYGAGRAVAGRPAEAAPGADGIVNATPVGMAKLPGTPMPLALVPATAWVVDIVYFPAETAFLAGARAKGCAVMNGAGMAVGQALRAFELFTGIAPDAGRMQAAFAEAAPSGEG